MAEIFHLESLSKFKPRSDEPTEDYVGSVHMYTDETDTLSLSITDASGDYSPEARRALARKLREAAMLIDDDAAKDVGDGHVMPVCTIAVYGDGTHSFVAVPDMLSYDEDFDYLRSQLNRAQGEMRAAFMEADSAGQ